MRAFFAIFLILLVGNPLCCCAVSFPSGDSRAEVASLPSCCQARLAGVPVEEEPAPEPSPGMPCPCTAKVGIIPVDKLVVPTAVPGIRIPAIPLQTVFASLDRREQICRFLSSGSSVSPAAMSPPPRLLYGVFRC